MESVNFGKLFEEYLLFRIGVSKNTFKFYKSDLNHFINWFLLRIRMFGFFAEDIESAVPYLNINEAVNYKIYLEESHTPIKTINRRLSALRRFAEFLVENRFLSFNFMDGITNSGVKETSQRIPQTTTKHHLPNLKYFFSISNIIKFGLIELFLTTVFLILLKINPSLNPWVVVNKIQSNYLIKLSFAKDTITTNTVTGIATIPAGTDGLTIKNSKITDYAIVYIRPLQDTNQVLFIKTKGMGFFRAGFTQTTNVDVIFSWRIVDVK